MDTDKKEPEATAQGAHKLDKLPVLTADALVVRKNKDSHDLLLITRKFDPFKGKFALPGGHVDYSESPERGVLRELMEECGLQGNTVELLCVKGNPGRDPRYHTVTMAYTVSVEEGSEPTAGDDASTAKFYPLSEVQKMKDQFAFDHYEIVQELLTKLKVTQFDSFGRPYPTYKHVPAPILTADALVVRKNKESYDLLLITRGDEPYTGKLAIPGGHCDYNEDPEKGVLRELEEECNIKGKSLELLCVRGDPKRDPRYHVVTVAYIIGVDEGVEPKPGDDAATAKFYPLSELIKMKDQFAFDHWEIVQTLIKKLNV